MRHTLTPYIIIILYQKISSLSTPITKSQTKTCPTYPNPTPVTYIEFKDTQSLISSIIQPNGKTTDNQRPAKFQLDPCNGNSLFVTSHHQYITAWVKMEPDTFLSPISNNHNNPELNFLLRTAVLKDKEFFGSPGRAAPNLENGNKMMIPSSHQSWIFLLFKVEKILTENEEYTRMGISRSFSENENEILDGNANFDEGKNLLQKCTSMIFQDRSFYNDAELEFKTDICQFQEIQEIWIPNFIHDEILNEKNFEDYLAFGGKMEVIERWNFQLMDRRHLEKLYDNKLNIDDLQDLMKTSAPGGKSIMYDASPLKKFPFKNFDFSSKNHLSTTSILKTIVYKKNGDSGYIKQKFFFKMKNEALSISETLIEFEISFLTTKHSSTNWDSEGKVSFSFYEYDSSSSSNKKETSPSINSNKMISGSSVEILKWVYSTSVELVPESVSEDLVNPSEISKMFLRVTVEFSPYIESPTWNYANEKIVSITRIMKLETKLNKDNLFFFAGDMATSDSGGGAKDVFLVDIAHLSGAGSHKKSLEGVSTETAKIKDSNSGTMKEYPDSGSCMWKSLFGFECPHCSKGYLNLWFNEKTLECKNDFISGLSYNNGCGNAYNQTHCRYCNYDGYYLDWFGRGVCRKQSQKCPDGFGSYQHQASSSWDYWIRKSCLTCPVNCKKCFYKDNNGDLIYCRESFQEVEDNGYNTTVNALNEPTCALENCAVCEREKCDMCKSDFILKIDIIDNFKEFECVSVSGNSNNRCPTGYLEARNSSNRYFQDFCFRDSAPPYGYYKTNIGYDYYEACSGDCTICSTMSQIDSNSAILANPNPLCESCDSNSKVYKLFHPVQDPDNSLCFDLEIASVCQKKNLTNDCSECISGVSNRAIIRTSSFTYDCSCGVGYFDDYIHKTGCQPYPHNCNFASLDSETKLLNCKQCKSSHPRNFGTGACASDCVSHCAVCNGASLCDQCYQGYYLSLDKSICSPEGCLPGQGEFPESSESYVCVNCKTCLTADSCAECLGANFLTGDKSTCGGSCPIGEGKDESSNPKVCRTCSTEFCEICTENFIQCDQCTTGKLLIQNKTGSFCLDSCQNGTYYSLEDLNCLPCSIENCDSCTSSLPQCGSCFSNYYLNNDKCEPCGENCLECSLNECLTCSEGTEKDQENQKNCLQNKSEEETQNLIEYFHEQIFEIYEEEYHYALKLNLNKSDIDIFDFSLSKEEILFKVKEETSKEIITSVTKYYKKIGLITYLKTNPESNSQNKIKITIELKHEKISEKPLTNLKQNPQIMTLERTTKIDKNEIEESSEQSTQIAHTGTISEGSSLVVSAIVLLESGDPTGMVLKFGQYVSLVHRLKFLNIHFGEKFDPFLNKLGGWDDDKESILKEKKLKRLLEFTEEFDETEINQKNYRKKFNRFLEGFQFSTGFIVKEIIYCVFWLMKIYIFFIFEEMKTEGEVCSEMRFKAIRLIRKFHFMVFNATVLDFFFYGSRLLLHKKLTTSSDFFVKTAVFLIFSLKIFDILEMLNKTQNLKKIMLEEEKLGEEVEKVEPKKVKKNPKKKIFPSRKKNFRKKTQRILEELPIKKKIVDFEKTFNYHSRNKTLENSTKEYINLERESFESTAILHSNNLHVIRLSIYQIVIVSLMNLPTFAAFILFTSELAFNLPVILTSIFTKGKVKKFFLIVKIVEFFCIGGLFTIFFLICFQQGEEGINVDKRLQDWGIRLLMAGYIFEIVVLVISIFAGIYFSIIEWRKRKKKERDVKELGKVGDKEGEYFYKFKVVKEEECEKGFIKMKLGLEMEKGGKKKKNNVGFSRRLGMGKAVNMFRRRSEKVNRTRGKLEINGV